MIKKRKAQKAAKFQKNNYHLWSNGRLFSLILIGVSLLFLILSIIEIPYLSAIPGYTFGLLFGYYSYIFYAFIIYYSTCKLFNINIFLIKKISKIKVLHYSWFNIFILTFGIMLLIETSFYINENKIAFPGVDAWTDNFQSWWKDFTFYNDGAKPNINNSGVIINLILSILFSLGGTIVAVIFSILLIGYFFFYLLYSSPIKKILNKRAKKKKEANTNEEYETKIVDLSFEDGNKIIVTEFGDKIIGENTREIMMEEEKRKSKTKTKKKPNLIELGDSLKQQSTFTTIMEAQDKTMEELIEIPFENPFDEPKIVMSSATATAEVKVKKRKEVKFEDTEFLFSNIVEGKKNENLSIYNQTQSMQIQKKKLKKKKDK